mgnify:CR=1 FL=1
MAQSPDSNTQLSSGARVLRETASVAPGAHTQPLVRGSSLVVEASFWETVDEGAHPQQKKCPWALLESRRKSLEFQIGQYFYYMTRVKEKGLDPRKFSGGVVSSGHFVILSLLFVFYIALLFIWLRLNRNVLTCCTHIEIFVSVLCNQTGASI